MSCCNSRLNQTQPAIIKPDNHDIREHQQIEWPVGNEDCRKGWWPTILPSLEVIHHYTPERKLRNKKRVKRVLLPFCFLTALCCEQAQTMIKILELPNLGMSRIWADHSHMTTHSVAWKIDQHPTLQIDTYLFRSFCHLMNRWLQKQLIDFEHRLNLLEKNDGRTLVYKCHIHFRKFFSVFI